MTVVTARRLPIHRFAARNRWQPPRQRIKYVTVTHAAIAPSSRSPRPTFVNPLTASGLVHPGSGGSLLHSFASPTTVTMIGLPDRTTMPRSLSDNRGSPVAALELISPRFLAVPLLVAFSVVIHIWAKKTYREMVMADARSLHLTVDGGASVRSNEVRLPHRLRSLAPLTIFPSLRNLRVSSGQISDLSPLRKLSNLQSVSLKGCVRLSSIGELTNCHNLESLFVTSTNIDDLTPLQSLTRLRKVGISDTRVTNLATLRTAPVESLGISGLHLDSLSPVNASIKSLSMFGTVVDISRLHEFRELERLEIEIRSAGELVHIVQCVQLQELALIGPTMPK